jgi:thiamine biosynthesis lipoprotein ApbE
VISENCIDADAFATLAFTMDVDSFLNVVNSHEGVECFLITIDDNEIVSFYESENFNDFIY